MKKITAAALCIFLLLSVLTFVPASAEEVTAVRELGNMYVSKVNGIWTKPYDNCLILMTPGQSVTGLYYHKLYAVYDEAKGGYVVQKKVAAHLSYTQVVAGNAIGLCFNYTTIVSTGANESRKNWKVWTKIREGDLLKLSGIDVKTKTIDTSGTWGQSDFVSNAVINVTTTREEFSGTAYSDVKVLALGDSLTPNGGWTEKIGDMLGTDIINSGEGADRTDEAINRFNRDVAAFEPDVVLIMFGANDLNQGSSYNTYWREKFEENLETLYAKCEAIGAKAVFMTPTKMKYSAYEARFKAYGGIDYCYKQFLKTIKDVAERHDCVFVDNFTQYESIDNIEDYIIDNGHPNEKGYNMIIGTISEALIYNAEKLTGKKIGDIIPLKSGSKFSLTDGKYLCGVKPGDTAEDIIASLDIDAEIEGDIGTGCKVKCITDKGYITAGVEVVIKGDADGNGKIDSTDYITVKRALLSLSKPEGAFAKACDADGSGKIDATDYITIKRHILNIHSL